MNSDNHLPDKQIPDKQMSDKQISAPPIEEQINRALDNSIEALSPEVRRRLNQARISATEKKFSSPIYWKTASAFSLVFALAVGWQLLETPMPIDDTPFADVLQEDLEMLDDLEFVYWMAEEQQSAAL